MSGGKRWRLSGNILVFSIIVVVFAMFLVSAMRVIWTGSETWPDKLNHTSEFIAANLKIKSLTVGLSDRTHTMEKVISDLESISHEYENNAQVHARLAEVYMSLGIAQNLTLHHLKQQVHLLETQLPKSNKLKDLPTEQNETENALVNAYYAVATHLMVNKGDRREISKYLQAVLKWNPSHTAARHWLAVQLSRLPRTAKDVAALLRPVKPSDFEGSNINPLDSFMLLGQAEDRLGNLNASAVAFNHGTQLYTYQKQQAALEGRALDQSIEFRFALSYFQLSKALYLQGLIEEASKVAEAACANPVWNGNIFQLHDIAALIQATRGDIDGAIESYLAGFQHIQSWPVEHRRLANRVLGATLSFILLNQSKKSFNIIDKNVVNLPAAGGKSVQEKSTDQQDFLESSEGRNMDVVSRPLQNISDQSTFFSKARCNIDIRPGLTPEDFITEYADRNIPVIIPGAISEWPALKEGRWNISQFLERYGNYSIRLRRSSDVAFDQEFGGMLRLRMTIAEYVNKYFWQPTNITYTRGDVDEAEIVENYDDDPWYAIGMENIPESIHQDYVDPPSFFSDNADIPGGRFDWTTDERRKSALFYLGVRGSGVSFHEHTNAWNGLAYGQKRWFMFPPYQAYGPMGDNMAHWIKYWYPVMKNRIVECTQQAGDLLYVPSNWLHAVINTENSIGVAVEVGFNRKLLPKQLERYYREYSDDKIDHRED